MFYWLHNFIPPQDFIHLGPFTIRWYGLFVVLGIIAALNISLLLAKKAKLNPNKIWDLAFYLVLFGIIGARLYEILLEFPYYLQHPAQIIKIWEGGLAIHGAIIAGLITTYYFARQQKLDFWLLAAVITPGLAIGQAIGRFGNWFNQELYGLPTNLPWGIPIESSHKTPELINYYFFHPTFFYESLGLLIIFAWLFFWFWYNRETGKQFYIKITLSYLISASVLRFLLEFIKADKTPILFGLRWPQLLSLLIIFSSLLIINQKKHV